MTTRVIALYGKSCSLKSDVARELSRMTGNKVKHPGEWITTLAKAAKLDSGARVADEHHRALDDETRRMVDGLEELWIIESGMLDAALGPRDDVFWVRLEARDDVREARWQRRREEGGGRTRQIGESLAQRDREDEALRGRLYPQGAPSIEPALVLDTSQRSASECAAAILSALQSRTGISLSLAKTEMDKSARRGIRPGPSSGTVRSYAPGRPPFGGYIHDDTSDKDLYVHKSVVDEAGLGELVAGQKVSYDVVEDGFGGFKATKLQAVG